MGKVQVVMLETNTRAVEGLKAFYAQAFASLGYETDFEVLHSSKNLSQKGSRSIFEEKIVDVFVCDLTLGNLDATDGLTLIHRIKLKYPSLYVVANSWTNLEVRQYASRVPNFDLFVLKSQMNDVAYVDYVQHKLETDFRRNVHLHVDFANSELAEEFGHTHHRIALEAILRSITFVSHRCDETTAVAYVRLEPIGGGKSGSQVYRMYARTPGGLDCTHAVLKLSKTKVTRDEVANYLRYVKWYLPYTWRPEMMGYGSWEPWGGVCYAFVYNDASPFHTLTHHLQAGEFAPVDNAIEQIFRPEYQRWYHATNVQVDARGNLTGHYHEKWFPPERVHLEEEFFSALEGATATRDGRVVVSGDSYPTPEGFLLGVPRTGFGTCFCHGDLNSGNVLVSAKGDVVFIDFQSVGRGHVYEDFVVFEISLRLYWNAGVCLKDLLGSEIAIVDGDLSASPLSERILKIRQYAQRNFPKEDFRNYLYAVCMSSYSLYRWKSLENWQKAQLAACLLASMKKLEALEKELVAST